MRFGPDQVYAVIDLESFSECDLKLCGSFEYSAHPSTEILCAAIRIGTKETLRETKTETWVPGQSILTLVRALLDPSVMLAAHNVGFEAAIIRNVFAVKYMGTGVSDEWEKRRKKVQAIGPERWLCTASLAAALALPRKLADVAAALKLPVQKDMDGHRLMLKWCKPRKATKNNAAIRHTDPAELKRLVAYCATDVDTEVELLLRLPNLSSLERRVWELDQRVNHRGFAVDRELTFAALKMIDEETKALTAETQAVTRGELETVRQVQATRDWLEAQDVYLPDLRAKTVADALKAGLADGAARRILEIRQAASKSSTAKYQAFELRSRFDGRCRDNLVYHAAGTGRWGGSGVQPQNLPRGSIKEVELAADVVKSGDLEMLRLLFGDPMAVLASCLRGVIVPRKGYEIYCADYAAIEARVLFWMADHTEGIAAFAANAPIYEMMAARIFGKMLPDVTKDERQLGKAAVLGAGFGMGPKKFRATCLANGQEVSEELADLAIKSYRTVHKPVVNLWSALEKAAVSAVENPGKAYAIHHTKWYMRGKFLFCQLPSGRRLSYPYAEVRYEMNKWEEVRPTLYFWGVNPKIKKWTEEHTYGGSLAENCCGQETQVLTSRGWLSIVNIRDSDLVFDGAEWVPHSGLVYQGEQETGEWLGVRLTGNHLILAGKNWKSATSLDDFASSESLNLGRALVPWWLRNRALATVLAPFAVAIAGLSMRSKRVPLSGRHGLAAKSAGGFPEVLYAPNRRVIRRSCRIKKFWPFGYTDIPVWCRDAGIKVTKRIRTMAGAASLFMAPGLATVNVFSDMRKHSPAGISGNSTWIESIMTGVTPPEICAVSAEPRMRVIGAITVWWNTSARNFRWPLLPKLSARSGKASTLFTAIWGAEKLRNKSWRTTGKSEKVYDLLNCGPRHRFVILTDRGPVIAHNCVQAVARDFMAEAMLRCEAKGYPVVLSVHDESLNERKKNTGGSLKEFERLMGELPPWAKGFPMKVEGWVGQRYRK